jgi:hypothetical protein
MEDSTDPCKFAIVQATIESVDDTTVTFMTRSTDASGNPDLTLRQAFTVPLSEIYTKPMDGAPPPVPLTPGATGNLYLSRTGWETTTADGFAIYGVKEAVFKYPVCAALPTAMATELRVVPTSIVLRGHIEGQGAVVELELLGPEAAPSQKLAWNGADLVEVRLTPRGAQRLGLDPQALTARVWPLRLTVKGCPVFDSSLSGEVDALDSELARTVQLIEFAEPGAPVTLWLTQDGVNAFHVTPQIVAELSR